MSRNGGGSNNGRDYDIGDAPDLLDAARDLQGLDDPWDDAKHEAIVSAVEDIIDQLDFIDTTVGEIQIQQFEWMMEVVKLVPGVDVTPIEESPLFVLRENQRALQAAEGVKTITMAVEHWRTQVTPQLETAWHSAKDRVTAAESGAWSGADAETYAEMAAANQEQISKLHHTGAAMALALENIQSSMEQAMVDYVVAAVEAIITLTEHIIGIIAAILTKDLGKALLCVLGLVGSWDELVKHGETMKAAFLTTMSFGDAQMSTVAAALGGSPGWKVPAV